MRMRVGLLVTVVATLVFAANAMAGTLATRYAEPGGNGPNPCLISDPCDIQVAVETAPPGAPVSLATGTYNLGADELQVAGNVDVLGVGFPDETILQSTADIAVHVVFASPGSFLQSFTIDHDPTSAASGVHGLSVEAGTAEFVNVDSTTPGPACYTTGLIRDSLCVNSSATSGTAAGLFGAVDATGTLVNVTAVATGANGRGLFVNATQAGADLALVGHNVLVLAPQADQVGLAAAGATADIDLSHSSFEGGGNEFELTGGATGTLASVNSNQDAEVLPPLLDATYHQLPGSPTINAGNGLASNLGALDFELDARSQGIAPDIGADESDGTAPDTEITKNPKNRTKRRTAVFEFESEESGVGFECKIDGKPFQPCNAGEIKYKRLKRKRHTFQVRADDGFNVDPDPATDSWKIRKKN